MPQTGHAFLQRVGLAAMRTFGWRFEGAFPNRERFVVIIAPHTSNWDFFVLLAAKWALNIDVRWMGKHSIFFGPVGVLLRALGGIAVERDSTHNVVDRSIQAFAERKKMVLVLAPEGTRRKVGWKTGFWHIAKGAGVPIASVALDFRRKVIRLGPEFDATDDDATIGIERIRASFAGVTGRNPELQA